MLAKWPAVRGWSFLAVSLTLSAIVLGLPHPFELQSAASDETTGRSKPVDWGLVPAQNPAKGDDTFSCLHTFSGPVVQITGDQGYDSLVHPEWTPETRFDARTARWSSHLTNIEAERKNCQPVRLGADWQGCPPNRFDLYADKINVPPPGPSLCFVGGTFIGTQRKDLTWGNVKSSAGATITVNAKRATVDGGRFDNQEDPFLPMTSEYFEFLNNWITYNRDDCIENDGFAKGLVQDNLFDGCFVFYSGINDTVSNPPVALGGGKNGLVEIRDNLIRMQNMPGPGRKGKTSSRIGYGNPIKTWDDNNANPIIFYNNVFFFEKPKHAGAAHIKLFRSELKGCSNNIIVWAGDGPFPGPYPDTCFTVTKDMSVWNRAKQNWINCHPNVRRISGDPESDPNRCQPNALGGGLGATGIPY
jgi:hypothetical protein